MEKFQKLDIKLDTHNKNNQLDRFIIAPLERGMGTTIGNSLRRILLSYIPGASIFAIKIAGVAHEYQAIDGVKEDVTEIILNLKNLVIKKSDGSIIFDDSLDINESNASLKIMS
jgi:DNA-directed RNA polymerase subunit alpha